VSVAQERRAELECYEGSLLDDRATWHCLHGIPVLRCPSPPFATITAAPRAEAVERFFPKIAYCCSDVVLLLGTDPLHNL
jgi:hypothetical protein